MISYSFKYTIIINLTILFLAINANAQLSSNKPAGSKFLNYSKPKINVSLSSSFSSFGNGYAAFGTTLMPQITFPVSDRFSVSTGVGYTSLFAGSDNMFGSSSGSYGHLFVSGDYLVNDKVTLRGTAYKTFRLGANPAIIGEKGQLINDFSSHGFIMDIEYKVSENFRVNVGVEYRKQNYPFYQPGINSPGQFMGIDNPSGSFINHGLNPSW